jgi:hypothetical protein
MQWIWSGYDVFAYLLPKRNVHLSFSLQNLSHCQGMFGSETRRSI